MELNIKTQIKSASLQRTEIQAEITHKEETTPSRAKIQEAIAKKTKANQELVIVSNVNALFGATSFIVTAYVYNSMNALKTFELTHMAKRNEVIKPKEAEEESKQEEEAEKPSEA